MPELDKSKDRIAGSIFGMTSDKAIAEEICIDCQEPIKEKLKSRLDKSEYLISGLCPDCFENIVGHKETDINLL